MGLYLGLAVIGVSIIGVIVFASLVAGDRYEDACERHFGLSHWKDHG